jgi:hypothetical protein
MNSLYPYLIQNIDTMGIPKRCVRCDTDLYIGDQYRAIKDRHEKYCVKCIGFFLSRYSFTWKIEIPSAEEMFWKEYWNDQIREKILAGICG